MKRLFEVFVEMLTTRRYVVTAQTPDEAERIAEDKAESGHNGKVVEREILSVSAAPLEGEEEDEPEEE